MNGNRINFYTLSKEILGELLRKPTHRLKKLRNIFREKKYSSHQGGAGGCTSEPKFWLIGDILDEIDKELERRKNAR